MRWTEGAARVVALAAVLMAVGCGGGAPSDADLARDWRAPNATSVDRAKEGTTPRLRVAEHLIETDGKRDILRRPATSVRALLGPPDKITESGRVWAYIVLRRQTGGTAGQACTRTLEVHFDTHRRVGSLGVGPETCDR